MDTLNILWDDSRLGLGIGPDDPGYVRLCAHYMEPHRRYHDLGHIDACLLRFEGVRHLAERPSEVATALFFHDVIYEPLASDNEVQSAAFMRAMLSAAGADRLAIDRIEAAILCTQHHDRPPSSDAALVLDIDMSILAERPEVFDAYEDAVRAEYALIDDASFAAGRSAFVRSNLERPVIFHTPELAARWDATARANLRRALDRWSR